MTNTNVTPIESKQPAPAARFTIAAMIDGFPVQVEVEGKADSLRAMIDRLKAIGAEPPSQTPQGSAKPAGAHSTPVCPVHGSPMKASRKPGKFYCSKKADDDEYCRETA